MLRKLVLLLLAIQLPWITTCALGSPALDDLSVRLAKHVTNYNLGVFNLVGALIHVSNDFQIPMGIVWVDAPGERAELPFAWKDATVQEIIETIAKTHPGYHVQAKSGVVHISPSPSLIPDPTNFLGLKIGAFEVHNAYVEVASFKLHMLVTPRRYGQISIGATGDSRVTLQLKNPTVEDALDSIATASNRKIWVVTFSDDPRLTARGLRRSMSLWSDKPQPDEEQPGWDLIRWGDPMPPAVVVPK